MRKILSFFCIFLATAAAWAGVVPPRSQHIECSIEPSDRSSVHPDGTSPFVHDENVTEVSTNWSGYVAATNLQNPATGSVDEVIGSWVVPTLTRTSNDSYCAIWVGIDGFSSDSVEQIGTSHDWINGRQQNSAWFEMYPEDSYTIVGFPVNNGDTITAVVEYIGNDTFQLALYNITRGVHTIIPTSYTRSTTAKRNCAEWVVEAPYSGGILPLSAFGSATFNSCTATINNINGPINSPHWHYDSITMETANKIIKAMPSALLNQGIRFSVTWGHE